MTTEDWNERHRACRLLPLCPGRRRGHCHRDLRHRRRGEAELRPRCCSPDRNRARAARGRRCEVHHPGGGAAEGETEAAEMTNGPARTTRSSGGPWMARGARASGSILLAGLCLSVRRCGGGQGVGGGPSSAPTLVATNAVSSSAIARSAGRSALAVAGPSVSHADCVVKAWTYFPMASWAGCDFFLNPACVPSGPAPTAEQWAASVVVGYPYTTGDPAPNDMTVFAAQVDAACAEVGGVTSVPTGTPTATPTAAATPTFTATFTPTWTPTAAPPPTATSPPPPPTPTTTPTPTNTATVTATAIPALPADFRATFTAPVAGVYPLWHRVIALTSNSDSFFVSIDGGPEFIDDDCEGLWPCTGATWSPLTHRGADGVPSTTPSALTLAAGQTVNIAFRIRDAGSNLLQTSFGTPGPSATPTPTPTPTWTAVPPTATPTRMPTATFTYTPTPTPTRTQTPTATWIPTSIPTSSPTPIPTSTPTPTLTATWSDQDRDQHIKALETVVYTPTASHP